jgi:xylulokinase
MGDNILSIDIGTTGCKAALFDKEGHMLVEAYREYDFSSPKPDWAEQDPALWSTSTQQVVREVLTKSKLRSDDVCAVGVTGQSPAVVALGKDEQPIRPAIIWMDQRATKQTLLIEEHTGKTDPTHLVPTVLWIKENEPEVYRNTAKFFEKASDYIAHVLTGESSWAALIPYDDALAIIGSLQLDENKFPEVKRADQIVGEVTGPVEESTGLRKGTPVVSSGTDGVCSIYGTGVMRPGEAVTVIGTSTCVDTCLKEKTLDPKKRVWSTYNLVLEKWVMAGCTNTSGASYKWFRNVFCDLEAKQAEESGADLYELLDREAEKAQPGSDGLIFLPYLKGERSPVWDSHARGVFFGIKWNHGKSEFLRAILEGATFSWYDIVATIEEVGARINDVRVCGGGAKSPLWRQIEADVSGKPILLPEVTDASQLGAAIIAARAVGVYKTSQEAAEKMVRIVDRKQPNPRRHDYYSKLFEIYRELYLDLRSTYKKAASFPSDLE